MLWPTSLLQLPLSSRERWAVTPWRVTRPVQRPVAAQVLAASMRRVGVLVPVVVRELPGQPLEVLDGVWRLTAAQAAGLGYVPTLHLGALPDLEAALVVLDLHGPGVDTDPVRLAALVAHLEGAEPGIVARLTAYGPQDVEALLALAANPAADPTDEAQSDLFAAAAAATVAQDQP